MIFVGLNNPGTEYERTRHNAGEIILRLLFPHLDFVYDKYLDARIARTEWKSEPLTVLLPQTFMNVSGTSVKKIVERCDASLDELVIFHDDIDLPLGTFKISRARGAGGQNGVRSIHSSLGTNDYYRDRIGIAHPDFFSHEGHRKSVKDKVRSYVLGRFSDEELGTLKQLSPTLLVELAKRIKNKE